MFSNEALFVSLIRPYNRLGISGIEIPIRNLGTEENNSFAIINKENINNNKCID